VVAAPDKAAQLAVGARTSAGESQRKVFSTFRGGCLPRLQPKRGRRRVGDFARCRRLIEAGFRRSGGQRFECQGMEHSVRDDVQARGCGYGGGFGAEQHPKQLVSLLTPAQVVQGIQFVEHTRAQFGNARMVKELSSVANQLGRKQTLCEVYGAGGWDLRFKDMKRIGDWLEVLGVNVLNQHLSYVTIRGARKRDHAQSFSYHAPWWDAYPFRPT